MGTMSSSFIMFDPNPHQHLNHMISSLVIPQLTDSSFNTLENLEFVIFFCI